MFDVLLFLGFASLIVRFHDNVSKAGANLDATARYIGEAQTQLQK